MTGRVFQTLDEEQGRAVRHTGGPLIVFAGAGSGKTRVIVHKVAFLIESGVDPSRILCLTFTNKAANEMKMRLQGLLGTRNVPVWAGTFHSFGAWLLRREAHRLGHPSSFAIYDEADQRSLVAKCLKELGLERERGRVSRIAWLLNMSKDTLRPLSSFPFEDHVDPEQVISLYEKRKKAAGAFDFADLISVPSRLLSTDADMKALYQERFSHILVDEYQDTNAAQYRLLMELVGPGRNICVVGDDDQSIYGWRGADVGNILRFKDDFPDAAVVVLEKNYRSTEEILKAASSLIAHNCRRAPKNLRSACGPGLGVTVVEYEDSREEADRTAHAVRALLDSGVAPSGIAVFYRVNAISRLFEESFVRRAIPYAVFGGIRFYERREVKDLLAYLRVVANPSDEEAFSRIVNVPPRGMGEKGLATVHALAREKGIPLVAALKDALSRGLLRGASARGAGEFLALVDDLSDTAGKVEVAELLEAVIRRTGYMEYLLAETDGEDRVLNVQELVSSAGGQTDLASYLQEKALISSIDEAGDDRVSLMTLHMSKGLEFDHVFIAGCEEGLLPHARSLEDADDIEEERRLLYVGITRARRQAVLSWARVRGIHGRHAFQMPSGFLSEIGLGQNFT